MTERALGLEIRGSVFHYCQVLQVRVGGDLCHLMEYTWFWLLFHFSFRCCISSLLNLMWDLFPLADAFY